MLRRAVVFSCWIAAANGWRVQPLAQRPRHGRLSLLAPLVTMSDRVRYSRGQKVKIEILHWTTNGARAKILDDEEEAETMIYGNDILWFQDAHQTDLLPGDTLFAWVVNLRDDDLKVDLSLKEIGPHRLQKVRDLVMDALEGSPSGSLPIGDKSSPESINDCLPGVSKTEFKNTVGSLYKEGQLTPGDTEIRLAGSEGDEEQDAFLHGTQSVQTLIMDALEGSPTLSLPIGFFSSPESIHASLPGVSQSAFHNAVASLYKQGWVVPGETDIRLTTIEEEEEIKSRASAVAGAGTSFDRRVNVKKPDEELGRSGSHDARQAQHLVMDALECSPTLSLPVGENSSPTSIEAYVPGVSHSEFQNALASLCRQGRVISGETGIRLPTIEEKDDLRGAEQDGGLDGYGSGVSTKIHRKSRHAKPDLAAGNFAVLRNLPDEIDEDILEETLCKLTDAEKILSLQISVRSTGKRKAYIESTFRDVAQVVNDIDGKECMGKIIFANLYDNSRRGRNSAKKWRRNAHKQWRINAPGREGKPAGDNFYWRGAGGRERGVAMGRDRWR